jgi:hypothetical protein
MLAKIDREYTPEILDSLRPSKKVKKNETIEPVTEETEDKEKKKGDEIEEEN